jgi:hypothetical protein
MQFKKLLFKALYSPKDILPSLNRILHTKRINTYKKKIHDANIVWHTCTPKSASTFFMNYCKSTLINSSKDFAILQGVPTYENRPQITCDYTLIKSLKNTADVNFTNHQHVLATIDLLDKITDNHVVICQTRSILDTIVSLIDHQDDKKKPRQEINSHAPMSHYYWGQLSYEEKLNNIIENYLPWHLSYLQGWIIASKNYNIKWLNYDEVINDPKKYFNQVFSKFNISSTKENGASQDKWNFNKGIKGRGKTLITELYQEEIIKKILKADHLKQNLISFL